MYPVRKALSISIILVNLISNLVILADIDDQLIELSGVQGGLIVWLDFR